VPFSPPNAERIRALRAIAHEHGCSPDKANEIYWERWAAEKQQKFQSFNANLQETAKTFEEIANTLPRRQREAFVDLPLKAALGMAVRHFAPRQRGRCEGRPRVRIVRRRSSRSTRAGPSDPDDPEPGPSSGLLSHNLLESTKPGGCRARVRAVPTTPAVGAAGERRDDVRVSRK
jgi:hypothetical protein